MSKSIALRESILNNIHVLDGGMASELEYLGADINGPLWSAHVLEDSPEKIVAVHRAYIEAGADIIETASYQVSRMGYTEVGLDPGREPLPGNVEPSVSGTSPKILPGLRSPSLRSTPSNNLVTSIFPSSTTKSARSSPS